MNVPENLKYAETHEWIRIDGDTGIVGITDHAQAELTDIVYVEPPKAGTNVKAGAACAVVESVKAASDIYAPVDGEVIAANDQLSSAPGMVNTDPYGEGWLFKIRLSDPSQLGKLKSPEDYRAQIG